MYDLNIPFLASDCPVLQSLDRNGIIQLNLEDQDVNTIEGKNS